ncbi:MAG: hypothetical protein BAJALOKI1v1_750019 [Promethearchaeota archaeon]|nr:MAG: hypothetical protein BAJALOKI1v1_750019 [Candidatus Lokiarchaeota archaeon]
MNLLKFENARVHREDLESSVIHTPTSLATAYKYLFSAYSHCRL